MILIHYFTYYLRDTNLINNKIVTLNNVYYFFKTFNHNVWPRYNAKILDMNINENVFNNFTECVVNYRKRLCNFDDDAFSLEPRVVRVLMEFFFDILCWVLGPMLIQKSSMSPQTYASLIIKHLEVFDMRYVVLNNNIPGSLSDIPSWLMNGSNDESYDSEKNEIAHFVERGTFMFPDGNSDYDSGDEDSDAEYYHLSGENRAAVDLSIPDEEDTDFNDSDSEMEIWDAGEDYRISMESVQEAEKKKKEMRDLDDKIKEMNRNAENVDDYLLNQKKKIQSQITILERQIYTASVTMKKK